MRALAGARCWLGAALAAGAIAAAADDSTDWLYDVPYVPTPLQVVDTMLELARVDGRDFLMDLGSGDGRMPIRAAKRFGTRGLGIEIDPPLVSQARAAAEREGVARLVSFREENLYLADIRDATVLTLYLLPQVLERLAPRFLKELKPGTRIVSHDFAIDGWRPDAHVTVPVPDKPYGPPRSEIYLWVVPADASGSWTWRAGDSVVNLRLAQTFQMLKGGIEAGGGSRPIAEGRMRGDEIRFILAGAPGQAYRGRVSGDVIEGTVSESGRETPWRAVRAR